MITDQRIERFSDFFLFLFINILFTTNMIIFQKEFQKTIDKHRIVCYISYSKSITTIQI